MRTKICLFGSGDFVSFFLVLCPPHLVAEWHGQFGYYRHYQGPGGRFDWFELDHSCYDLWADCFVVGEEVYLRVK